MDLRRFFANEREKPLDTLPPNGGMCAIFPRIGCIGDSLTAGEFVSRTPDGCTEYHDLYEFSWPAYLGRLTGCEALPFAAGGMTAQCYCDSFANRRRLWSIPCHAYIIALGVNDLYHAHQELGSAEDIDFSDWRRCRKTFAGYYGQLLLRLREVQPRAPLFLMTIPRDHRDAAAPEYGEQHAALLTSLTERFSGAYLLDFRRYAPPYDADFREKFFLGGHMNACGYLLTAQMVAAYVDYIIRHNMEQFREAGFIGTEFSWETPQHTRRDVTARGAESSSFPDAR